MFTSPKLTLPLPDHPVDLPRVNGQEACHAHTHSRVVDIAMASALRRVEDDLVYEGRVTT